MSAIKFTRRVDAIAYYVKATGLQPAKSWTIKQMVENADAGKVSRSAKGKAAAVALYTSTTGVAPAASWSASKCLQNATTKTLPRSRPGSGMTVAELRKRATELQLPGRSKWNKAELVAHIAAAEARLVVAA